MQLFIINEETGDVRRRPGGPAYGRIGVLGDTATREERDSSLLQQGFKRLQVRRDGVLARYKHCTVIVQAGEGADIQLEAVEGPVIKMRQLIRQAFKQAGFPLAPNSVASDAILDGVENALRESGYIRHGYLRFWAEPER